MNGSIQSKRQAFGISDPLFSLSESQCSLHPPSAGVASIADRVARITVQSPRS